MNWPSDFSKVKWTPGEMSLEGGESYLMPFGPHAKRSQVESKNIKQEPLKEVCKTPKESEKT